MDERKTGRCHHTCCNQLDLESLKSCQIVCMPHNFLSGGTYDQGHCSRLKSSMSFKHDFALPNIPLLKQSFKTQPQIENEDVT